MTMLGMNSKEAYVHLFFNEYERVSAEKETIQL